MGVSAEQGMCLKLLAITVVTILPLLNRVWIEDLQRAVTCACTYNSLLDDWQY